jgi:hypothetical protein
MNNEEIWLMIKMRGLGFNLEEIGEKLAVSDSAIQWNLVKLKQMALKESLNAVYNKYMRIKSPLFKIEVV